MDEERLADGGAAGEGDGEIARDHLCARSEQRGVRVQLRALEAEVADLAGVGPVVGVQPEVRLPAQRRVPDRHALHLVVHEHARRRRVAEAERAVGEREDDLGVQIKPTVSSAVVSGEAACRAFDVDLDEVEPSVGEDEVAVSLVLGGGDARLGDDPAVRVDDLVALARRESDHELVRAPFGAERRARPGGVLPHRAGLVAEVEEGIGADADRGIAHEHRLHALVRATGVAEEEGRVGERVAREGVVVRRASEAHGRLEEVALQQPEREREIRLLFEGHRLEPGEAVSRKRTQRSVVVARHEPADRGRDPGRPRSGGEERYLGVSHLEVVERRRCLLVERIGRRLSRERYEREGCEREEGYAGTHVRYTIGLR